MHSTWERSFCRSWRGSTSVDTVILSDAYFEDADLVSLLFHECVHVVQYRQLGVEGFMRRLGIQLYGLFRDLVGERRLCIGTLIPISGAPSVFVEDVVALRLKSKSRKALVRTEALHFHRPTSGSRCPGSPWKIRLRSYILKIWWRFYPSPRERRAC